MEYNYENWKEEKSIVKVCEALLDNADMDINIVSTPFSVTLMFFVVGSDIKVTFHCCDVTKFHIKKEYDDIPLHLVLEVNVTEPRNKRAPAMNDFEYGTLNQDDFSWKIDIYPEAELNIECLKFSWKLTKATKEELSYRELKST